MNRAQRQQHQPVPLTWGETWERCPFRSFVGIGQPGVANEMAGRIEHVYAALGGEAAPISGELLEAMVASIRSGRTVLVISEIIARVHGAADFA